MHKNLSFFQTGLKFQVQTFNFRNTSSSSSQQQPCHMYGRARFMFLPTLIQVQNENIQKISNFKKYLGSMRFPKKHKD